MNKLFLVFGVILSVAVVTFASPAKQCPGLKFDDLEERINVDPCKKKRCDLPKERDINVRFRFRPEHVVKKLVNNVSAEISGITLPFIGVYGSDACQDIYHEDGKTRAPCPLEPGKEYIYTKSFYTYSVYPSVYLKVHWSLDDGNKKVICFEIPAKILDAKSTSSKQG